MKKKQWREIEKYLFSGVLLGFSSVYMTVLRPVIQVDTRNHPSLKTTECNLVFVSRDLKFTISKSDCRVCSCGLFVHAYFAFL